MTEKELLAKVIADLGYHPQTDEDGVLHFMFQMKTVCVIPGDEGEHTPALLLPHFDEVAESEVHLALAACNQLTREVKLVKVFVNNTYQSVHASYEFYYSDEECLRESVERGLDVFAVIRTMYTRTKNALQEAITNK